MLKVIEKQPKGRKDKRMEKLYLTASDLSEMIGISMGHAYKLIRGCNEELRKDGYLVVAGKVPKKFFAKKYYGYEEMMKEENDARIS
jgi:hypothetical protein